MKLGIMTAIFKRHPLAEAVRRIRGLGFSAVHLNVNHEHPDTTFLTAPIDAAMAQRTGAPFAAAGLEIATVAGYINFMDSRPTARAAAQERFGHLIKHCHDFGGRIVASGAGTLAADPWAFHPENRTAATFNQFISYLQPFVAQAEALGVTIAIEPFIQHVVYDLDSAERLLTAINVPALKLVLDPTNFLTRATVGQQEALLRALFRRFSGRFAVAHAKDFALGSGEGAGYRADNETAVAGLSYPGAGLGLLDYPLYLQLLQASMPEVCLLLEHLQEEDVARARDYVLRVWPT